MIEDIVIVSYLLVATGIMVALVFSENHEVTVFLIILAVLVGWLVVPLCIVGFLLGKIHNLGKTVIWRRK